MRSLLLINVVELEHLFMSYLKVKIYCTNLLVLSLKSWQLAAFEQFFILTY